MYEFTILEDKDGAAHILGQGNCSTLETAMAQGAPGQRQVYIGEQLHADLFYFLDYQPTPRPKIAPDTMDVPADGVTIVEITGWPAGTRACVQQLKDGKRNVLHDWQPVDDGIVAWRTGNPGTYELRVEPPFPFQAQIVVVTAHAV